MTFHEVSLSEIVFKLQILHTIERSSNVGYNPSVLFNLTSPSAETGKIMLQIGKNLYSHVQIVCVTYPNILKMGVQMGTVNCLGKTLNPVKGWYWNAYQLLNLRALKISM